jgi:hypothetical protein
MAMNEQVMTAPNGPQEEEWGAKGDDDDMGRWSEMQPSTLLVIEHP